MGTPQLAHLYKRVAIPEAFLNETDGKAWGGDIRIGDLTGDGTADPSGVQVARRYSSLLSRCVHTGRRTDLVAR